MDPLLRVGGRFGFAATPPREVAPPTVAGSTLIGAKSPLSWVAHCERCIRLIGKISITTSFALTLEGLMA
jgi:hypothetical protein